MPSSINPLRAFAALALAAMVLSASGCGSSDDEDSSAATAPTTTGSDFGKPAGKEEEQVALIVENTYAYLAAGDTATVCERLTSGTQKELASSDAGSCKAALDEVVASAGKAGNLERAGNARVGAVNITKDKNEATAVVAFGNQAAQMELRPGGAGWLFDSPPVLPSN